MARTSETLLRENLHAVFGEHDIQKRQSNIARLWAEDGVFIDHNARYEGHSPGSGPGDRGFESRLPDHAHRQPAGRHNRSHDDARCNVATRQKNGAFNKFEDLREAQRCRCRSLPTVDVPPGCSTTSASVLAGPWTSGPCPGSLSRTKPFPL